MIVDREDVEAIVDYLYKDEEKDYEERGRPDNHIFLNLANLKIDLEDELE
jgi:hypothetical protein